MHRRCDTCQRLVRTEASKEWTCPHCNRRNRVPRAAPVRANRVAPLLSTALDKYAAEEEEKAEH